MSEVSFSNQDINRFWLNILADNCLIVYNAFSPDNANQAMQLKELARVLDNLSETAGQNVSGDRLAELNKDAYSTVQDYRFFLVSLWNTTLTKKIHFDLKPNMINDMINMAEYYAYLISAFMQGKSPERNPITEDIFWSSTFEAQSEYIADNIGRYESVYRDKAVQFDSLFHEHWAMSTEYYGVLRLGKGNYPVLKAHRRQMLLIVEDYFKYISNLVTSVNESQVPGSLSVLFLDRSRRLACYYLIHLAGLNSAKTPGCDPYAQRISTL